MKKLAQLLTKVSLCLMVMLWSMNAYGQGVNTARPLGSTSSPFGYYEYLPLDYNKNSNNYPVVVFLHGAGQVGNGSSQLSYVLKHGTPKVIQSGKDYPFIVVSPQSPIRNWNVDNLNVFIEYVKKRYRVNTAKIYMTGLSMGAIGTYNYASKYNQQLAAIVPIAGKANLNTICNMSNTPMWVFHGQIDGTISVQYAKNAVAAYNACSPTPNPLAKLTIYPNVSHGAWFKTYDGSAGHDIYKWMLQYSKGSTRTTTPTNVAPTVNAGSDKTITLPTNSISLYGSASDSDGSIASTIWTKVNGPSCSMSGTWSRKLSLSNMSAGTYTFRLTAKDNAGATKYDDVLVTVKSSTSTNAAPTVNAGSDKTITLPTNSISLYGSASDSDGSIASTIWTKVNGPSCSMSGTWSRKLSLSNMSAGTYTFRLTAKDNAGATKYDDVMVTVKSSTTTTTSPLAAPSNLIGKVNTYKTAVYLNWKDNSSAESGFEIYRSTGNNTSYTLVGSTGSNKISYTVGISSSQTYYFRLRAKNSSGYSSYSNEIKVANGTTTTSTSTSSSGSDSYSLPAPSSLVPKLNSYKTAVGLSWRDNSSNESSFEIWMSIGNTTSYKKVGSTGSNKTSYTVGVSTGKTYYFKIRAINSSGKSAYSNQVSVANYTSTTASIGSIEEVEEEALTQVVAYPNPATDYVEISFGSEFQENVKVQLVDLSGRTIYSETVNASESSSLRIDLRDKSMMNGIYIIKLDDGLQQKAIKLLKR